MIHTVKGFGIVNKTEVDVFLELSCFFDDPTDVGNLISGSFKNPAWTSGNSWFMYCWSLGWKILNITLLACKMSTTEHSLTLPFFGIGMKTDIFQSCGHSWVFQVCWHIECSTFTASSFRIFNSSAGMPSPLSLLAIMNHAQGPSHDHGCTLIPPRHLAGTVASPGDPWDTFGGKNYALGQVQVQAGSLRKIISWSQCLSEGIW